MNDKLFTWDKVTLPIVGFMFFKNMPDTKMKITTLTQFIMVIEIMKKLPDCNHMIFCNHKDDDQGFMWLDRHEKSKRWKTEFRQEDEPMFSLG